MKPEIFSGRGLKKKSARGIISAASETGSSGRRSIFVDFRIQLTKNFSHFL